MREKIQQLRSGHDKSRVRVTTKLQSYLPWAIDRDVNKVLTEKSKTTSCWVTLKRTLTQQKKACVPVGLVSLKKMIFTPRSQSEKKDLWETLNKLMRQRCRNIIWFWNFKTNDSGLQIGVNNVRHRSRFCELKKRLQSSFFHTSLHKYIKIIYLRNKNVVKLYF